MNTVGKNYTLPKINSKRQKINLLFIAVIIYLSFLAVERIDLLQGKGSFSLTLELLGCIIFLFCCFFNILIKLGKIQFSIQLKEYAKIVFVFMMTILISVFFSADPGLSIRRIILLSIYVFSGLLCVNYLITQQKDNMISAVVNCMIFLSIFYAICTLYDVLAWFFPDISSKIGTLFPSFRNNIWTLGSTFVRIRGASGDPNRAGIFMIVNLHIILKYCKKPVLKVVICVLNVLMLVFTLSRTSYICLILYIILQAAASNKFKFSKKVIFRVIAAIPLAVIIAVGLYQVPLIQEAIGHTFSRLFKGDASADDHILFLQKGLVTAFTNFKIILVGNGYGVSDNVLGNGKYSNFHNAFISFLVECGMLSLVFFVLLLLYPLKKNKSQFPIFAILILANITYQIYVEPYFWFLIPFLCVMPQLQCENLIPENRKEIL